MFDQRRKAIAHLEESLKINPKYLPALFLLCESKIENDDNKSAKQYLDRIKDIEPENPKYLYLSSKLAHKNGDLNKAKRILDRSLANKNYDKDTLSLGLEIAKNLKSSKDKILILENWLLHHNASVDQYLELAKSLDQPNHYEKACYYFKVAQELAPQRIDVLIEGARFHLKAKQEQTDGTIISKRDHKRAKRILENILVIEKDSFDAICMLGDINFQEEEYSSAKKYYRVCYRANFKRNRYLLKLARIAEISSQFNLQVKLLLEASYYEDLTPESFDELFKIKLNQSKFADALPLGLKAIKYYRRSIRTLKKEIDKFLKFNLFIEAKELAKKLRFVKNKLANIYYNFSELPDLTTRKEKYLDEVLIFDSSHPEANFEKAMLLKTRKSVKSTEHLKACIDNSWYHWQARWEYICLNEKKMSNEELTSFLKIICEVNPSHKESKYKLEKLVSSCS